MTTEQGASEGMRFGQSVRTIIELLILAGVLWLANSASEQGKQLAAINVQVIDLKASLADVPSLARQADVTKQRLDDHDRRILRLETDRANR